MTVSTCSEIIIYIYILWKQIRCTNSTYQEHRVQYIDPPGRAKGIHCHNLHGCVVRAVDSSSSSGSSVMLSFFFYVNTQGARRNVYVPSTTRPVRRRMSKLYQTYVA